MLTNTLYSKLTEQKACELTGYQSLLKKIADITNYGNTNQGINRLAYSKEEQKAIEYLIEIALVIELSVERDTIGNLIIRRKRIDDHLPVVAMG